MSSEPTGSGRPPGGGPPKLLDQVRWRLRTLHYAIRTEDAYLHWIRRFILYHGKRHPRDMGPPEIEEFLTHLAVRGHVAASTQTQALCAILFLYKHVLKRRRPHRARTPRPRRRQHHDDLHPRPPKRRQRRRQPARPTLSNEAAPRLAATRQGSAERRVINPSRRLVLSTSSLCVSA